MDATRRGEIAYAMLKNYLATQVSFRDIADSRRNFGRITQETDISPEDLAEFGEKILREIFEDQMKKGFGSRARVVD